MSNMKLKYFVILLTLSLTSTTLFSQTVKWMSIEEAMEKSKIQKRKIFIDVYTDWCGWCKVMDRETFSTSFIAEYLNKNYYPVRFNAEQKKDIVFKGQVYSYIKNGNSGYHNFAAQIMRGKLSYPTSVFLDENLNLIQPLPGYLKPEDFEKIMTYFALDKYKDTPWPNYERNYISPVNKK